MTGFSGLTGGAGWFLGLKTLFFCNFKLKTENSPLTESQRHGE
jgi:hypothetical protein